MTKAIKTKNLTKSFKEKNAVKDVNIEIEPGEVYGFLGPNGAGKSTTIKMLVTLLKPSSGDAFIFGENINKNFNDIRLKIGVALQEASLDGQQTGIELLKLQGMLYGLNNNEIKSRLKNLTDLIDIGPALDKRIKTYSGGMKRRLDLAASIIHNPQILFLDEPTTGLDPISRNKVWREIERLNKDLGMTIFLTTQYLEEADQLAERIGIINSGQIAAEGTPTELKNNVGEDIIIARGFDINKELIDEIKKLENISDISEDRDVLRIVSKDGSKIIGKVALIFEKMDLSLEQLTLRTTSLDDVFIKVTGDKLSESEND